mmetsp:Transcript_820/g.660  ORF Transcript_820/g.660 Transcript_820/m.660 type:complete len:252 (-) Transcript_820:863-1618(-)
MINEPFAYGTSFLHKIDPRYKILFAVIYSFVIALSNSLTTLTAALLFSIVLVVCAQLNIRKVFKRLSVVFSFLIMIWVFLPFTFEGEALYSIGMFNITRQGVSLCATISLKSAAVLIGFMALIATMSTAALCQALESLHVSKKNVYLILITYRYIFVLQQEYKRLLTSAKIRGFRSKTNLHSYKTYSYLIGMLFIRASARATRVHQAMVCRGFKGKFYSLGEFTQGRKNWIFSVCMIIAISALFVLEWFNI